MIVLSEPKPMEGDSSIENCVFNVSFDGIGSRRNKSLCVGLTYIGRNPNKASSYEFSEAILWRQGLEPTVLAKSNAERILKKKGVIDDGDKIEEVFRYLT